MTFYEDCKLEKSYESSQHTAGQLYYRGLTHRNQIGSFAFQQNDLSAC